MIIFLCYMFNYYPDFICEHYGKKMKKRIKSGYGLSYQEWLYGNRMIEDRPKLFDDTVKNFIEEQGKTPAEFDV